MGASGLLNKDGVGNIVEDEKIIKLFKEKFENPSILVDDGYKPAKKPRIMKLGAHGRNTLLHDLGLALYSIYKKNRKNKYGGSIPPQRTFLGKKDFVYDGEGLLMRLKKVKSKYGCYVDIVNGYAWLVGDLAFPIKYVKIDKAKLEKRMRLITAHIKNQSPTESL